MRIYSVLPITKTLNKEFLSYFGADGIRTGAVVSIPLRSKDAPAIVINSEPLSQVKSEIRKSSFALKKIKSVKNELVISPEFLRAAQKTSNYFASNLGSVLFHLLPKFFLENNFLWKNKQYATEDRLEKKISSNLLILQTEDDERYSFYKSLIREEFARGNSIFFATPTIEDALKLKESLDKGVGDYLFLLNITGKKEAKNISDRIKNESHPLIFIGTIPTLSIVEDRINTIVVERENSKAYKTLSRPFIDLKKFAENLAKEKGIKLIYGDTLLSLETYERYTNDELSELSKPKSRLISPAVCIVSDLKLKSGEFEEKFKVIGNELKETLIEASEESSSVFIYVGRRGVAPITVCGDCGKLLSCKVCDAPLVLHKESKKDTIYICHKCGTERDSLTKCSNCDSWKLTPLGVGTDRVREEIEKEFPDKKIFELNSDVTKSAKNARETIKKFENSPGSILLGTEMALLYLSNPVPYTAVASVDSLLSIPNFRANERVFYTLLKTRSLAVKKFIIQTRDAENKIFERATSGNISDFYREEMDERERFNYPPFKIFIKISLSGKKDVVTEEMNTLSDLFKDTDFSIFTGLHKNKNSEFSLSALIRIDPREWPNESVVKRILSLPPQFEIQVDPENLL